MTESEKEIGGAPILHDGRYLSLTYDEKRLPKTAYPRRLAAYLTKSFLAPRGRLLDVGSGRGDFLEAFMGQGLQVAGVDISPAAPGLAPNHDVRVADLEREAMPFDKDSFDFAFSKSVLEHTRAPLKLLAEIKSTLKSGGVVIIMVPAWETGYKGSFYIDHTHITPFTLPSLEDAMQLAGFELVHSQLFWQLPFVWRRPWLLPLLWVIRMLPLPYRPMQKTNWPDSVNKIIWFSKEAMLLCVGRKPVA
ncbi:MAG TPA: class I SAM-dependent methyltransferase [Rhizomicrobium sp.]|jgi:SAM-dependent methyltransferase|nr:class I SAM-dependent methyltransferase [Rhizomicrobium sp.]